MGGAVRLPRGLAGGLDLRQLLYCRRDAGLAATGFYSVFMPFHAEATVSKMYGTAMNACTQL